MNVTVRGIPLLLCLLLITGIASAQTTVATSPVGYNQITCTGSSDTVVSVPFNQPAVYVGQIVSVSGSTIIVSSTANWTASQYVYSGSGSSTYFVQMGAASSGTDPVEGSTYLITANGTNTLTIYLNGDSISSVPTGTSISVIPYWTIATVFPATAEISVNPNGSFQASTTNRLTQLNTQILTPDYSAVGINNALENRYFYYGDWKLYGDSSPTHYAGDDILPPNGYFVVRNANTPNTTLTTVGSVLTGKSMVPLAADASTQQDNLVSMVQPVSITLDETDLGGGTAFVTSTTNRLTELADQVLLYSNTTAGINQAPTYRYFFYQGHWALYGDPNGNSYDRGSTVIQPGSGFIIRKAANGTGATAFWQSTPTY